MKLVVCLVVAMVLTAAAAFPCQADDLKNNPDLNERWELYKKKFDKSYSTPEIEARRRGLWEAAVKMIDQHNEEYKEGKQKYSMIENKLADMTDEEARNNMYIDDV